MKEKRGEIREIQDVGFLEPMSYKCSYQTEAP